MPATQRGPSVLNAMIKRVIRLNGSTLMCSKSKDNLSSYYDTGEGAQGIQLSVTGELLIFRQFVS